MEQARAAHIAETEGLAGRGPDVDASTTRPPAASPCACTSRTDARGTVAYLHGGGWVMGNLDSVDAVCRRLANEAQARVVSIDYRLAPEHPFPAALETRSRPCRRSTATSSIAGDSAGGNLAAVVARKLRDRFKLQLLVYPVTDAGVNTPSYAEFDEGHGLTAAAMRRFWGLYLNGGNGLDPDASPLRAHDLTGVAPAYIVTASHDVLRDEGEAYAAALRTRRRAGHAQAPARARSTASGAGRRPRSRATRCVMPQPRSAPR